MMHRAIGKPSLSDIYGIETTLGFVPCDDEVFLLVGRACFLGLEEEVVGMVRVLYFASRRPFHRVIRKHTGDNLQAMLARQAKGFVNVP